MYDITVKTLLNISGKIEGDDAYPKVNMMLLSLWKEKENDNALDLFLAKHPKYLKLLEIMEKEKILIKGKLNMDNKIVITFLSYLVTDDSKGATNMLKEYDNMWAGKMGCGSSGNIYLLLADNREAFLEFIKNNREVEMTEIKEAVDKYFSTLQKRGDKYLYAMKSNNFLQKIEGYLNKKKSQNSNRLTAIDDIFVRDI